MGPNPENDLDAWHYAWHRAPTLRERLCEALSTRAAFIVLGIATIIMLTIALGLGVALAVK